MNQPFNDTMMIYDFQAHRYVLTETAVYQELGINLDTEFDSFEQDIRQRKKERFLKKVSDTVYGYIYQDSTNSRFLEWILACREDVRSAIQEMLLAQAEYVLEGNNFLQDFSGVNIAKGTAMKKDDLRGEIRIALRVVEMCKEYIGNLDFVLKTIVPLPDVPQQYYRVGY